MLMRFLADENSHDGDMYLYVLIEGEDAFPATSSEPLDISEYQCEREILLAIKEHFGGKTFPQIITRSLQQAQIIFNVKCRRISKEMAFDQLQFTLV